MLPFTKYRKRKKHKKNILPEKEKPGMRGVANDFLLRLRIMFDLMLCKKMIWIEKILTREYKC